MEKLYIAYGSNLNIDQMKRRCPNSKVICTSELKDYELNFKGSLENAHATVDYKKCSIVPVMIWKIDQQDEKNLDRYEGFPNYYRKEEIEIDVLSLKEKAMIYIMNGQNFGMPNKSYFKTIEQGYKDAKFNLNYFYERVQNSILQIGNDSQEKNQGLKMDF